jgi:prolyl-tRNA synthetase
MLTIYDSIQELADFLNRPVDEIVKSMIFKIDGEFIMFLIRGQS